MATTDTVEAVFPDEPAHRTWHVHWPDGSWTEHGAGDTAEVPVDQAEALGLLTDEDAGASASSPTGEPSDAWLKADLVEYAEAHGLDASGKKADILARIHGDEDGDDAEGADEGGDEDAGGDA